MTFSMIHPASTDDHASKDHVFEAWEAIRRAQRVDWEAAHSQKWRNEFRRYVAEAHDRIVAHHQASRAAGSPLARLLASAGEEARLVREHLAEHRWLRERLNELLEAVESRAAGTLEDVVELTERAIFVEIQLARHQNRFRGLVRDEQPMAGRELAGAIQQVSR